MKDFDRKDVFSWYNANDARQYIGQFGYFCDCCVKNAKEWGYGKLTQISLDSAVDEIFCHDDGCLYGLFLPADKVREIEEKEKKWRPFNDFEEFSKTLNKKIGSEILYRNKDYPLRYIHTTIMGYIEHELYEDLIQIGTGTLKFSDYFKQIEIWNGEKWQPFGVLEND